MVVEVAVPEELEDPPVELPDEPLPVEPVELPLDSPESSSLSWTGQPVSVTRSRITGTNAMRMYFVMSALLCKKPEDVQVTADAQDD